MMNGLSLSRLHRRMTAARPRPAIDAVDLADGLPADESQRDALAAKLAASPAHADLARMLRALEADSQALARDVAVARRRSIAHVVPLREARPAAGARRSQGHRLQGHRLRWAGAMAASLAVALGLWAEHGRRHEPAVAAQAVAPQSDRIFASHDVIFATTSDRRHAAPAAPAKDDLFRSDFSGS